MRAKRASKDLFLKKNDFYKRGPKGRAVFIQYSGWATSSEMFARTLNRTPNYANIEFGLQNRTPNFPNIPKKTEHRTPNTVRSNTRRDYAMPATGNCKLNL